MEKLIELLNKENYIWAHIERKQRQKFLKFAKDNGFKWINGNEIYLNDDCWLVVAMFADRTIANIPAMHRVFGNDHNAVCKIDFSELVKGKY